MQRGVHETGIRDVLTQVNVSGHGRNGPGRVAIAVPASCVDCEPPLVVIGAFSGLAGVSGVFRPKGRGKCPKR